MKKELIPKKEKLALDCRVLKNENYVTENVEIEILRFSEIDFMICQDEIFRLANENKIFLRSLEHYCSVTEQLFFSDKNISSGDYRGIRHCCTYSAIDFRGGVFFGSGSASHDNIANWSYKSFSYDLAHKRAKVNALRTALGLLSYQVELEGYNKTSDNVDSNESDNKTKEVSVSISPNLQQAKAVLSLARRMYLASGKITKDIDNISSLVNCIREDKNFLFLIEDENLSSFLVIIEDAQNSQDIIETLVNFSTKTKVEEYLSTYGNFTTGVIKPGAKK